MSLTNWNKRSFMLNLKRQAGLLGIVMVALAAGFGSAAGQTQMIRLKSAEFDPLQSPPALAAAVPARKAALAPGEQRLALVQWDSEVSKEKLDDLKGLGVKLIAPIPDHAYLVSAPSTLDLGRLARSGRFQAQGVKSGLRWGGAMEVAWKLHPRVAEKLRQAQSAAQGPAGQRVKKATAPAETQKYNLQLAFTGGEDAVRDAMRKLCRSVRLRSSWAKFETWTVEADPGAIEALSQLNGIFWIEPYYEPKLNGERSGLAIANKIIADGSAVTGPGTYGAWLNQVGLSGAGITVQVIDDGLSQGNTSNKPGTAHPDILGRIAGIDNATIEPLGNSFRGHGHINASIIMGQPLAGGGLRDSGGYLLGQGIAPQARVFATKVFRKDDSYDGAGRSYESLVKPAYAAGARISSNSWGGYANGDYTVDDQDFDRLVRDANPNLAGFQPMTFCFSAGNDGVKIGPKKSISSPATAKNVISVGATENSDKGELDRSGIGPLQADDLRDVADFSSRGPTSDGRFAPLVVAPGTHITGAASDDKAFDGEGVSGRVNVAPGEAPTAVKYYPAYQNYYTWSSGTSHSCPAVAGAVALFYEDYKKKTGVLPSPALAKAALVSGAIDSAGGSAYTPTLKKLANVPNNDVGWGRVCLSDLVGPKAKYFATDQTAATTFSYNGQMYTQYLTVSDPNKPLRIVLAWTDAPGTPGARACLVNDLDLAVSDGTQTWKGNVFAKGESLTGGAYDRVNNVECVFLAHPAPAVYKVTVTSHELSANVFDERNSDPKQDFALFANNGVTPNSIGHVFFDHNFYAASTPVMIALADSDLKGKGLAQVSVTCAATNDKENLTLREASKDAGVFSGRLLLQSSGAAVVGDGRMTVSNGAQLVVTYLDNTKDSRGNPLKSTDLATIDIRAPGLVSQAISNVEDISAVLNLTTTEPAQAVISLSAKVGDTDTSFSTTGFSKNMTINLAGLTGCTPYFYTITLTDQAGNKSVFNNNGYSYLFQTMGTQPLFSDDMEPVAISGWSHSAATGVDDWIVRTTDGIKAGNHAWFISDVSSVKDSSLVTPGVIVDEHSKLTFWHTYKFQPANASNLGYDGGVIEITTDNGLTWQDLGGYIQPFLDYSRGRISGPYDSTLQIGKGNPLGGRPAWSGGNFGPLSPVTVDLSSFAGQTIKVRFRIGCDNQYGGVGWFIDDVSISTVAQCVTGLAQLNLDSPTFSCSANSLHFRILDSDLSAKNGGTPSEFRLATQAYPLGIPVVPSLTGIVDPRGIWEGSFTIEPGDQPKTVKVAGLIDIKEGDWIKLLYTDTDAGGVQQIITAQAVLDCTPPSLLGQQILLVNDKSVTFRITAGETVLTRIRYGTSADSINQSVMTNVPAKVATLRLDNLTPCTPYYYQIDLIDGAGNTAVYKNSGYYYGVKTASRSLKLENFESSTASSWKAADNTRVPSPTFKLVATSSSYAHSKGHVWYGQASGYQRDGVLNMPAFTVANGTLLHFWHTYNFEYGFDGGVIEISTNGGKTWTDLRKQIIQGGYNLIIGGAQHSAIAGQMAWSGGALGPMSEVVVDLSPYAGANRRIRFRLVCDNGGSGAGWYIDDVSVDSLQTCGQGFPYNVNLSSPTHSASSLPYTQPVRLSWGPAANADAYQVYFGTSPNSLSLVAQTADTATLIPQSLLKGGATYYWQVLAVNDFALAPSSIWSFKTQTSP